MGNPVSRQHGESNTGTALGKQPRGSVCVGAATQTEKKAYAVDDKKPNLGDNYTAALEQKMKAGLSTPLVDLVRDLALRDVFERQYTIQAGDTWQGIAMKHGLPDAHRLFEDPRNNSLKPYRKSKPPVGKEVWISNKVPFPTSAYAAGKVVSSVTNPAKHALVCVNSDYSKTKYESNLGAAVFDGQMMEQVFKARGYQVQKKINCSAADLTVAFNNLLEKGIEGGPPPKAGDETCFYYSGHGEPEGLRCAQDGPNGLVLIATFTPGATKALGKGLHLALILDCCHSGSTADAIRKVAIELLEQETQDKKLKDVLAQLKSLQETKEKLALFENEMDKLFVQYGHISADTEHARKKGTPDELKAAQQNQAQFEQQFPQFLKHATAKVKDTWFSSLPKIKSTLDELEKQTGKDFYQNPKVRYKKIYELLKRKDNRSQFDQSWSKNNEQNDYRPEELDDLDDIMNTTLDYVREQLRKSK